MRDWDEGSVTWRLYSPCDAVPVTQGWKVHVTASVSEADTFLTKAATLLGALRAPFKVPARLADVAAINSGDGGEEQLGKVMTVYPRDDIHARAVIETLDRAWPGSCGPEIPTSLHLRPGSAVAFRFGVFTARDWLISSTGIHEFAVRLPDGGLIADRRVVGGHPPSGIEPPLPGVAATAWPVTPGDLIEIDGMVFHALAEIRRSALTRILLGVRDGCLSTVVLRQRRPGETRRAGEGAAARLHKEFAVLTSLASSGLAPVPVALGEAPWPILAIEDVRGELLSELQRPARVAALPVLARTLAVLHDAGIVHGDLKLENVIWRDGSTVLIDFELSERVGEPAGGGGTLGYLAPEVRAGVAAHPARDIYALGACIFQAVTGFVPSLLPGPSSLQAALLDNEGWPWMARLVERFTATDPEARPPAAECPALLDEAMQAMSGLPQDPWPAPEADLNSWCHDSALAAARLTASYRCHDTTGTRWRNEHFQRSFECEAINIGAAGIVLGLLAVERMRRTGEFLDTIDDAARWLAGRSSVPQAAGLFTGNAGVAVALAVAGRLFNRPSYIDAARVRLMAAAADTREYDLFSGSAGVLYAAAALHEVVEDAWPLEAGTLALRHLRRIEGCIEGIPAWGLDSSGAETYLGCAHGVAGIATALGCWGRMTSEQESLSLAIETFQAIMHRERAESSTDEEKGTRMTLQSEQRHAVGNWCHGTAGLLWGMLAGPGDRPELVEAIDWATGVFSTAPAVATPTYCHGLAGHLELWQMLQAVPRHRVRAEFAAAKVVRSLRILQQPHHGHAAWISDDPSIVTPDLWVGFMGPAAALAQHCAGSTAPLLSGRALSDLSAPLDGHSRGATRE